jgi:hypothetical protein
MRTGPAYVGSLAKLYVRVGETEQVLKSPAGFAVSPAILRLDPVWDPMRQDPEFQELVRSTPSAICDTAAP